MSSNSFVPESRSPELVARLSQLIKLTNKAADIPRVRVGFQQYMVMSGHYQIVKTGKIHTPYGVMWPEHREAIMQHLRTHILQCNGLDLLRGDPREAVIVSETHILGLVLLRSEQTYIGYTVLGVENLVTHIDKMIGDVFVGPSSPVLSRIKIDQQRGSLVSVDVVLPPRDPVSDIHHLYPYFDETPSEVWEQFAASNSNILLFMGPPGTGKSSFILEMLRARGWDSRVYVADREDVLASPNLADFIRSVPPGSLVITEDSDSLVAKRENGNKSMASLLNATSGIVPTDVKLIISTNLPTLRSVDEALLRPGRTFKVMQFKHLTVEEGQLVRETMGLEDVVLTAPNKHGITLAEAINWDVNDTERKAPEVGFG